MITVVIIGILASIAYPSYTAYIRKSNRAAAQALLSDISQKQQQYFMDARSYAGTAEILKINIPANVTKVYTVSFVTTDGPPPTFTASATPITGTIQSSDVDLSIDNTGKKLPADKW